MGASSPVNAAVSSAASALGIRHVNAPEHDPANATGELSSGPSTAGMSAGTGSTMAKNLSSATMARARRVPRGQSECVRDFVEDISHHLWPERLVDVPAREALHLLSPRVRSVG